MRYNVSPSPQHSSNARHKLPQILWDKCVDLYELTIPHRIACGLDAHDLDEVLGAYSTDFNKKDLAGFTPLDYAVIRQKKHHMRILLKRGAGFDNIVLKGAFRTGNLELIEILLSSGGYYGSIEQMIDTWARAYGFSGSAQLAMDKLMVSYFDINSRNAHGSTVLMECCLIPFTSVSRIKALLDYGAGINLTDNRGRSAVFYRVVYPEVQTFKTLIEHGACLDIKNIWGDTILHCAIRYTRVLSMVDALLDIDLSMVDLQARNIDGLTVVDLLKMRNGIKWESYCLEARRRIREPHFSRRYGASRAHSPDDEPKIIYGFEALLHKIQDSQGVPKEEQFPPLGEYLSSNNDEEPVPGAWPV